VTLLVEFTYCISDSSIFLCWLDQFKILFSNSKINRNWSQKSTEINKNFENFRLLFVSTSKQCLFEKLFLTDKIRCQICQFEEKDWNFSSAKKYSVYLQVMYLFYSNTTSCRRILSAGNLNNQIHFCINTVYRNATRHFINFFAFVIYSMYNIIYNFSFSFQFFYILLFS